MKTITKKELFELIQNEEWTHKTQTETGVYDWSEREVGESQLKIISTSSKLKITITKLYQYRLFVSNSIVDSEEVPSDIEPILIEDLQENKINVKTESNFHDVVDYLTKDFITPDLTELKDHLDEMQIFQLNCMIV